MPKFNEMKRVRSAGILLCGTVLAIAPAMALQCAPPAAPQGDAQGPPPGGPGGRGGMMNPERRLKMMETQLNLTPDQSTAIRAIFEDERTKMEAARSADASLSPEDRRAKMMAMRQDENTKIEAVLTPDQKTRYEAMMARQRERMENRQGDGPPPPPPQ
jgi:protein CpxP